jgi:hypothetical protein
VELRAPTAVKLGNIYSTILAGIQNLTVRKTQSEHTAVLGQTSQPTPIVTVSDEDALEDIFEEVESIKEICDLTDLKVIRRLSCFEEICPSSLNCDDSHSFYLPLGVAGQR